jgi:ribulose-phosphate 3-epimerase
LHRTIQKIKSLGVKAGVAINPHTNVNVLEDILPELDLVLVMSVNPGFGGQKFIPNAIEKVKALRKMIDAKNLSTLIEVDGGVDSSNARALESAGANVLVAGNAVFSAKDRNEMIKILKG